MLPQPQVYYPHINQYVFKNRKQIISLLIRTWFSFLCYSEENPESYGRLGPPPHLSAPTSHFLLIPSSHTPAAQQPRNTPSTPCLGALAPAPSPGMHSRDIHKTASLSVHLGLCSDISLSKQPFQTRLSEIHTEPDVLYVLKLLCLSLYHVFPLDFLFFYLFFFIIIFFFLICSEFCHTLK